MKFLKNLTGNKLGIIFAAGQWILLWFAMFNLPIFDTPQHEITWQALLIIIPVVNLPALILAAALCMPFYLITGSDKVLWYGIISVSHLTITLQWLMIGRLVYRFFNPVERKLTALSISND